MSAIRNWWIVGGAGSGTVVFTVLILFLLFGVGPANVDSYQDVPDLHDVENTIEINDNLEVSLSMLEPRDIQFTTKYTVLFCDMPATAEENATISVFWRLIDLASLRGVNDKVVVMTVLDQNMTIRATTNPGGYASAALDLSGLTPGRYSVYGFFDTDLLYNQSSCDGEFEIISVGGTVSVAGDESSTHNVMPVAMDDSVITTVNNNVLIDVLANDSDSDNDLLTVIGVTNPANGSIVNEVEGLVRYSPDIGFIGLDTFTYTISDGKGGESTATVSVTVYRPSGSSSFTPVCTDTILPQIEITTPPNGSITGGPSNGVFLNIEGIASDNSDGCGFDKVQVAIFNQDSEKVTRWYRQATPTGAEPDIWSEWSYQFKVYEEANYRIVARAFDGAGNIKWASSTIQTAFDSDATQPKVTIISPVNGEPVSTGGTLTVSISGTSFDAMSGVEKVEVRTGNTSYQLATPKALDDWSEWTHVYTFNALGIQTLVARATDAAGNMGWFVIEITLD